MSDRLAELRRQRALLQQHVEWIDREIAVELAKTKPEELAAKSPPATGPSAQRETHAASLMRAGSFSPTAPSARSLPGATKTSGAPANALGGSPDAERILDEYRVAPTSLHNDIRKGCFLYLAAAFLLVGAIVTLLYFTIGRH